MSGRVWLAVIAAHQLAAIIVHLLMSFQLGSASCFWCRLEASICTIINLLEMLHMFSLQTVFSGLYKRKSNPHKWHLSCVFVENIWYVLDKGINGLVKHYLTNRMHTRVKHKACCEYRLQEQFFKVHEMDLVSHNETKAVYMICILFKIAFFTICVFSFHLENRKQLSARARNQNCILLILDFTCIHMCVCVQNLPVGLFSLVTLLLLLDNGRWSCDTEMQLDEEPSPHWWSRVQREGARERERE